MRPPLCWCHIINNAKCRDRWFAEQTAADIFRCLRGLCMSTHLIRLKVSEATETHFRSIYHFFLLSTRDLLSHWHILVFFAWGILSLNTVLLAWFNRMLHALLTLHLFFQLQLGHKRMQLLPKWCSYCMCGRKQSNLKISDFQLWTLNKRAPINKHLKLKSSREGSQFLSIQSIIDNYALYFS